VQGATAFVERRAPPDVGDARGAPHRHSLASPPRFPAPPPGGRASRRPLPPYAASEERDAVGSIARTLQTSRSS